MNRRAETSEWPTKIDIGINHAADPEAATPVPGSRPEKAGRAQTAARQPPPCEAAWTADRALPTHAKRPRIATRSCSACRCPGGWRSPPGYLPVKTAHWENAPPLSRSGCSREITTSVLTTGYPFFDGSSIEQTTSPFTRAVMAGDAWGLAWAAP